VSDELVDIVDDDDHVIATVTRREMRAARLLHRSVGIAVMSSDGRLLVHRRSTDKDPCPRMWDIAAGGVVLAGETYEQAARRELAEELGVVDAVLELIGSGRFVDEAVAELFRGYRVAHDGPFTFDDGEVIEARWVTFAELAEMRSANQFLPDSITLLFPLLLAKFSA